MVSRILLWLAVLVSVASAATWMGVPPPKPLKHAHKTGCYVEEIDDVIPYGETVAPIGICYEISCGRRMMSYASCGVVGAGSDNCYVTDINPSKPYPNCCPTVECEQDNYLF